MLQDDISVVPESSPQPSTGRVGDLSAMLRVMRPLNLQLPDATIGRRRLLADLCRFIGVQVGTVSPESLGFAPDKLDEPGKSSQPPPRSDSPALATGELSPRQEQTLQLLLYGDSEKQVARKMGLSPHTVHSYVKALYRRYGVSSRAELLAKHLKK